MQPLDDTFREIPTHPAYRVARDGSVLSLRRSPIGVIHEHRTSHAHSWRVRIDGLDVRVRDLVWLIWGSSLAFDERAREWIDNNHPSRDQEEW